MENILDDGYGKFMIHIKNIKKLYSNNKGINSINFNINKGQPLGLLGKNGAGKTTTIKIILDIISPDSGLITTPAGISISYLPEERGIYNDLTVKENMEFFAKIKGLKKDFYNEDIKKLLKEFEVEEYLNFKVSLLSKGNVQKVQLAIALLGEPDFLVLDEPFSGLDPINRELFINIIKKRIKNTYMILSSHQLDILGDICSDICVLDNGMVKYYGSIESLLQKGIRNFEVKGSEKIYISEKLSPNEVKNYMLKNLDIFDDEYLEIKYEYPSLQDMYIELLEGNK
ncbi:MAG: ATP-binding cassette domain-containing protein [Clostridium perfringens]|nr:ATP-binding cassette domain-containing protein [Clostridium perfringens]